MSSTTVYLELSLSAKSSSFFDRVFGALDTASTSLSICDYSSLRSSLRIQQQQQ